MIFTLKINDRPFNAIKLGTKKIEGRVSTSHDDIPYSKVCIDDIIILVNRNTGEKLTTKVLWVNHYLSFRTMLEVEGPENILSSSGDLEKGIKSFEAFSEYKENVKKWGVYALRIDPIEDF